MHSQTILVLIKAKREVGRLVGGGVGVGVGGRGEGEERGSGRVWGRSIRGPHQCYNVRISILTVQGAPNF